MREAGVDSVRLPMFWSGIEATSPLVAKPDWSSFDKEVELAAEDDVRIMPFVWGSPEWVAAGTVGAAGEDVAGSAGRGRNSSAKRPAGTGRKGNSGKTTRSSTTCRSPTGRSGTRRTSSARSPKPTRPNTRS